MFGIGKKGSKISGDCTCGCSTGARDSVRLTDAEIARDILGDLENLGKEYACLCKEGCDCADKLRSCEHDKNCLCDYVDACGDK